MLFLQLPADAGAQAPPEPLPISHTTALALERALLAESSAARLDELSAALTADGNAASWALVTAEVRLGRTINRLDEGAAWLSGHLESELAAGLRLNAGSGTQSEPQDIEWRLPR